MARSPLSTSVSTWLTSRQFCSLQFLIYRGCTRDFTTIPSSGIVRAKPPEGTGVHAIRPTGCTGDRDSPSFNPKITIRRGCTRDSSHSHAMTVHFNRLYGRPVMRFCRVYMGVYTRKTTNIDRGVGLIFHVTGRVGALKSFKKIRGRSLPLRFTAVRQSEDTV